MQQSKQVIIGVDPHKLSATIEVVDEHERLLGSGRFTTDRAGYAAMRKYAKAWPDRVWAVEGANGVGRPLAQRLLEDGEHVVDVPAKLAARVRLFDTGHNRKTDALDAHSIAVVAVRTPNLRVLQIDGELEALRMLTDRREALTRRRVQTVDRLQAFGIEEIVVKNGADPALVATRKDREFIPVQKSINPVDTTAAGDSFNAGYIAARMRGEELDSAVRSAHATAADVVMHRGAIVPRAHKAMH